MHRRIASLSVLAVLATLVSCGDSPSTPSEEPEDTIDPACVDAALGTSSAQPFDRVELAGIDGVDEEHWVEFGTESGAAGVTAVLVDSTGRAEILAPVNPDDLMGGGPVTLAVTDGDLACGGLELEILPIPPATGDPLGDLVSAAERVTSGFADQLGLDPAALASTSLGDLPPHAVPVALMVDALAEMDPAAELAGMTADQAAFTQAVTAKLGLASMLNAMADARVFSGPSNARDGGTTLAGEAGPARDDDVLAIEGCQPLGSVPTGVLDIADPGSLSDYIKAARNADDTFGPLGDVIMDNGAAFAVMGLVAPPVGTVTGWAAFIGGLIEKMVANLYPSAISKLEYQLDHAQIEEDWDTERGDPEIRWAFAKLWATNNGMRLARVGLDLITTEYALGLPPGFSGAVAENAVGAIDIVAKEKLNTRLDELEQDPDGGAECWGIGQTEFGPVVVDDDTGDEWVRAEVTEGDAISIDAADVRRLHPERIGRAMLRVRTQDEPFPGPFGYEDKEVEVLRKEVVWIPSTLLVENPGGTKTIKFRVDNSRHDGPEDVEVVPGPSLGTVPAPTYSGGVHTIELTTPADREDYATYIDARSTSRELPPQEPTRTTRLDIFADESIEIAPREACVSSSDSVALSASASGPGDLTVVWEIESGAGSLSATTGSSARFIAPSTGNGTTTIRAYLAENPDIEDRVTFRYGACSGLVVYRGAAVKINFPFVAGGQCNNPDLDEEYRDVTIPEEEFDPWAEPAPADVWAGRSETFSHSLDGSGVFGGKPAGADACITASFLAEGGFEGTLAGSDDATRLDIDIDTYAESYCEDMGEDLGVRCSAGLASMGTVARFYLDISEATTYRLQVQLSCDSYPLPNAPDPTVSVITTRVRPDGSYVIPNPTTQPIHEPCGPENPTLDLDQVLEFAAAAEGETDRVIVSFDVTNVSVGAVEGVTEGRHTGYVRGFVSVEEQ